MDPTRRTGLEAEGDDAARRTALEAEVDEPAGNPMPGDQVSQETNLADPDLLNLRRTRVDLSKRFTEQTTIHTSQERRSPEGFIASQSTVFRRRSRREGEVAQDSTLQTGEGNLSRLIQTPQGSPRREALAKLLRDEPSQEKEKESVDPRKGSEARRDDRSPSGGRSRGESTEHSRQSSHSKSRHQGGGPSKPSSEGKGRDPSHERSSHGDKSVERKKGHSSHRSDRDDRHRRSSGESRDHGKHGRGKHERRERHHSDSRDRERQRQPERGSEGHKGQSKHHHKRHSSDSRGQSRDRSSEGTGKSRVHKDRSEHRVHQDVSQHRRESSEVEPAPSRDKTQKGKPQPEHTPFAQRREDKGHSDKPSYKEPMAKPTSIDKGQSVQPPVQQASTSRGDTPLQRQQQREAMLSEGTPGQHPYLDPLEPGESGMSESRIRRLLAQEHAVRVRTLSRRQPTERNIPIVHPKTGGLPATDFAAQPLGAGPLPTPHRSARIRYKRDITYERNMEHIQLTVNENLVPLAPADPTCSQMSLELVQLGYSKSLIHIDEWCVPTLADVLAAIGRIPDVQYGPLDTASGGPPANYKPRKPRSLAKSLQSSSNILQMANKPAEVVSIELMLREHFQRAVAYVPSDAMNCLFQSVLAQVSGFPMNYSASYLRRECLMRMCERFEHYEQIVRPNLAADNISYKQWLWNMSSDDAMADEIFLPVLRDIFDTIVVVQPQMNLNISLQDRMANYERGARFDAFRARDMQNLLPVDVPIVIVHNGGIHFVPTKPISSEERLRLSKALVFQAGCIMRYMLRRVPRSGLSEEEESAIGLMNDTIGQQLLHFRPAPTEVMTYIGPEIERLEVPTAQELDPSFERLPRRMDTAHAEDFDEIPQAVLEQMFREDRELNLERLKRSDRKTVYPVSASQEKALEEEKQRNVKLLQSGQSDSSSFGHDKSSSGISGIHELSADQSTLIAEESVIDATLTEDMQHPEDTEAPTEKSTDKVSKVSKPQEEGLAQPSEPRLPTLQVPEQGSNFSQTTFVINPDELPTGRRRIFGDVKVGREGAETVARGRAQSRGGTRSRGSSRGSGSRGSSRGSGSRGSGSSHAETSSRESSTGSGQSRQRYGGPGRPTKKPYPQSKQEAKEAKLRMSQLKGEKEKSGRNMRWYPCTELNDDGTPCNVWKNRTSDIKIHIEHDHEKIRYQCEECGEICGYAQSYKKHKKRHLKAEKYRCEICDEWGTNNRPNYDHHMVRVHGKGSLGERVFCTTCRRDFADLVDLRQHHRRVACWKYGMYSCPVKGCKKRNYSPRMAYLHVQTVHSSDVKRVWNIIRRRIALEKGVDVVEGEESPTEVELEDDDPIDPERLDAEDFTATDDTANTGDAIEGQVHQGTGIAAPKDAAEQATFGVAVKNLEQMEMSGRRKYTGKAVDAESGDEGPLRRDVWLGGSEQQGRIQLTTVPGSSQQRIVLPQPRAPAPAPARLVLQQRTGVRTRGPAPRSGISILADSPGIRMHTPAQQPAFQVPEIAPPRSAPVAGPRRALTDMGIGADPGIPRAATATPRVHMPSPVAPTISVHGRHPDPVPQVIHMPQDVQHTQGNVVTTAAEMVPQGNIVTVAIEVPPATQERPDEGELFQMELPVDLSLGQQLDIPGIDPEQDVLAQALHLSDISFDTSAVTSLPNVPTLEEQLIDTCQKAEAAQKEKELEEAADAEELFPGGRESKDESYCPDAEVEDLGDDDDDFVERPVLMDRRTSVPGAGSPQPGTSTSTSTSKSTTSKVFIVRGSKEHKKLLKEVKDLAVDEEAPIKVKETAQPTLTEAGKKFVAEAKEKREQGKITQKVLMEVIKGGTELIHQQRLEDERKFIEQQRLRRAAAGEARQKVIERMEEQAQEREAMHARALEEERADVAAQEQQKDRLAELRRKEIQWKEQQKQKQKDRTHPSVTPGPLRIAQGGDISEEQLSELSRRQTVSERTARRSEQSKERYEAKKRKEGEGKEKAPSTESMPEQQPEEQPQRRRSTPDSGSRGEVESVPVSAKTSSTSRSSTETKEAVKKRQTTAEQKKIKQLQSGHKVTGHGQSKSGRRQREALSEKESAATSAMYKTPQFTDFRFSDQTSTESDDMSDFQTKKRKVKRVHRSPRPAGGTGLTQSGSESGAESDRRTVTSLQSRGSSRTSRRSRSYSSSSEDTGKAKKRRRIRPISPTQRSPSVEDVTSSDDMNTQELRQMLRQPTTPERRELRRRTSQSSMSSSQARQLHATTEVQLEDVRSSMYRCPMCSRIFLSPEGYTEHFAAAHL